MLAACALLGVDEVHAAGGAQALAMFAYGTEDCRAGRRRHRPGQRLCGRGQARAPRRRRHRRRGRPDRGGDHRRRHRRPAGYVAADLIAQAEHDALAACLLVTTDRRRSPTGSTHELAAQVAATRHRERVRAGPGRPVRAACSSTTWTPALAVADAWAPEHLEIQAEDAAALAARVRNAGAVFVGPYAPVSLGDYLAGSNHVLPTGGTARHTSGLSVLSFLRGIHVSSATRDALAAGRPADRRARRRRGPGRARRRPSGACRVEIMTQGSMTLPAAGRPGGLTPTAPRSSTCRSG